MHIHCRYSFQLKVICKIYLRNVIKYKLFIPITEIFLALITEQQKTFTESDIFDNGYVGHVLL